MPRDPSGRKGYTRSGVPLTLASSTVQAPKDRFAMMDHGDDEDVFSLYRREYEDWDDQTQDDRDDSVIYRDYYDGLQWTSEEVDDLNERAQPILTKNLIAPKINFVLGSETENRVSPKAYPRTLHHEMDAEVATDGLRYATEADDFDQTRSSVAKDMFIEGYGGAVFHVECGCADYHGEECGTPKICLEPVLWDRLYYDPRSRKHDFSDAMYKGIIVWMHREEALAEFLHEDMDDEERARIESTIESAYARDYTDGDVTQDAPRRWRDSDDRVQFFETYRKTDGVWTVCYWTWSGFLHEPQEVDFVDEQGKTWCPLMLASCFSTRDNARYGLVKHMISPQDEVNKRASKALHLMHTTKVVSEEGAIMDPDTFQAELARPDGNPTVAPGRLKDNSIQILDNVQLAAAQLNMMDRAEAAINQIGPHAALVASDQRVQSGRMFMARQQAGSMEIKPAFDHLRHWTLRSYKGYWHLMRQYWTEERWFRVRDDPTHQGNRFVSLNRQMTRGERIKELVDDGMTIEDAVKHAIGPEGKKLLERIGAHVQNEAQQAQQFQQVAQQAQQMQQQGQEVPPQVQQLLQQPPPQPSDPFELLLQTQKAQEEFTDNDVAKLDVDIVLDTAPSSPIVRHEQFTELVNLAQTTLPAMTNEEARNRLQALIFQHSDLRDEAKRQFVDALMPKPPSPEEQQAQAQMQQMQQQQMQLAIQQLQATVNKLQADAAKSQAQAQKAAMETQVAVPAAAQLDNAQAAKAVADAELKPHEADLLQAQVYKTEAEAEVIEAGEEQQVPNKGSNSGTGGS